MVAASARAAAASVANAHTAAVAHTGPPNRIRRSPFSRGLRREASERYERKRKRGAIKEELDYLRFLQDLIAVEVELCRKSVIPAARTESRGAESNENE
jgi:hypothetical protein